MTPPHLTPDELAALALDFAAPGVALLNDRTDVGDTRGLGLFQDLVPDSRQAGGWDQSCHQDRIGGGEQIPEFLAVVLQKNSGTEHLMFSGTLPMCLIVMLVILSKCFASNLQ